MPSVPFAGEAISASWQSSPSLSLLTLLTCTYRTRKGHLEWRQRLLNTDLAACPRTWVLMAEQQGSLGYGLSVKAATWLGRTTLKWRWSRVAILGLVEALGEGDDTGVGSAEREIGVLLHELSRPAEVLIGRQLDFEERRLQRPQEPRLGCCTASSFDHERGFRDDRGRDNQLAGCLGEQTTAGLVVWFLAVGGSDERAGIDDHEAPKPRSRRNASVSRAPRTSDSKEPTNRTGQGLPPSSRPGGQPALRA
jgi:hypothetical protein